jgi:hypothetical protein
MSAQRATLDSYQANRAWQDADVNPSTAGGALTTARAVSQADY